MTEAEKKVFWKFLGLAASCKDLAFISPDLRFIDKNRLVTRLIELYEEDCSLKTTDKDTIQ